MDDDDTGTPWPCPGPLRSSCCGAAVLFYHREVHRYVAADPCHEAYQAAVRAGIADTRCRDCNAEVTV